MHGTVGTSRALSAARAYIAVMDEVEGWLSEASAQALCLLQAAQERLGIRGNLAEIGVHHGKSALLLSCFADPKEEWLYLNDIFEEQAANVSKSGLGDRDRLLVNLGRLRPAFARYTILLKPSQDLTAADFGRCRIFHIDGGHSAGETETDLQTASASLHPDGAIVVDDYFNESFPGVSEGVARFLARHGDIRPFVIGFNKMYFCRAANRAAYREELPETALMEEFSLESDRHAFYGDEVLLLRERPRRHPLAVRVRLPVEKLECRPGERIPLLLSVENVGASDIATAPGRDVALDYHLFRDGTAVQFDNRRVPLAPLARGERRLVEYPLVAPGEAGEYVCEFDGVIENVAWLKDTGGVTAKLRMVVA